MARSVTQTKVQQPKSPIVIAGFIGGALAGAALMILAVLTAVGWVPGVHRPDYGNVSAGDVGSLAVAGATLLLADFTAVLAWLTRRSLAATRWEAEIAEAALQASNRQAATAEGALAAAQEQARIASDTLRELRQSRELEWRPILVRATIESGVSSGKAYRQVELRNIGRGPALNSLFLREEAATEGSRFLMGGPVSIGAAGTETIRAVEQDKPVHPALFHRDEMPRELLICHDQFGNSFRFVPGFAAPAVWTREEDEQGLAAEPGWIKGQKEILYGRPPSPEPEPEPGYAFTQAVQVQGMAAQCDSTVAVEAVPASDLQPSDAMRDLVKEWMLSVNPKAGATSLEVARWTVQSPDKYGDIWGGWLSAGPMIGVSEVLNLQKRPPPPEVGGGFHADLPVAALVAFWKQVTSGALETMTKLGVKRVRLGLTLRTWGTTDQTTLVGIDFDGLPVPPREVVVSPYGQGASLKCPPFDVREFPGQFIESAVREVLRMFGFREVDEVIATLDLGTQA
jgi:hypothetical protein